MSVCSRLWEMNWQRTVASCGGALAEVAASEKIPGAATLRFFTVVDGALGTDPAGSPSFLGRPTGRLTGGGACGSMNLAFTPLPLGRPGPRLTGVTGAGSAPACNAGAVVCASSVGAGCDGPPWVLSVLGRL